MKLGFNRLLILFLLLFSSCLSANPVLDFIVGKNISGSYISDEKTILGKPCYIINIDSASGQWHGTCNGFSSPYDFMKFPSSGYSLEGNTLTLFIDTGDGQHGKSILTIKDGVLLSKEFGTLRKQ